MREDEEMANDKSAAIRDLNDRFRSGDKSVPGRTLITSGVNSLLEDTETELNQLLATVREFDEFSEANDPYHEHDFAAFEFLGRKLFWKVDYYSPDPRYGSDDPSDIAKTFRVLTILQAEEY
jgi:hypothetical protein